MDKLEYYISRAEVAYKGGETAIALREGRRALEFCESEAKAIALKIFIAKCLSKLGDTKASNAVYRDLICENVYLAPVISGLLYNHFVKGINESGNRVNLEKIRKSVNLMKIFVN